MRSHNTQNEIGEYPLYDIDTASTNKKLTRNIRRRFLTGEWPTESRQEDQLKRDFIASNLSVDEFLDKNT